ncbi:unnamed protein product, partial [Mucor hiemalis]
IQFTPIENQPLITKEIQKQEQPSIPVAVVEQTEPVVVVAAEKETVIVQEPEENKEPSKAIQKNKGRCFSCRTKIPLAKQLTNKCRCEYVFCDTHRYPDKHDCNFDHAQNDKDILLKNNPKLHDKPRGGNSFNRLDKWRLTLPLFNPLSFEKLENFDMQRSKLSSFVLVRNSLITALTLQQQQHHDMMMDYYDPTPNTQNDSILFEGREEEKEEQQVWLDSCFNELDGQGQIGIGEEEEEVDEYDDDFYGSSEEDEMPSSPQDEVGQPFYRNSSNNKFFINEDEEEEEDGLICYDIPFLSLIDQRPPHTMSY